MEDITKEFLDKCKDAGYERVTIYISDSRIPLSKKLEKDSKKPGCFGYYWGNNINVPYKVVCGYPERIGKHPNLQGRCWPKIWGIVINLGLTAGLEFDGFGSGDSHEVKPELIDMLKPGYYDLS